MSLAGSEGIWLYAIIGIASLIYKAWKKNQEDKNNGSEPEENVSPKTSFGFEDLIQQFEEKYGVQKEHESVDEPKVDEVVPIVNEAIVSPKDDKMSESEIPDYNQVQKNKTKVAPASGGYSDSFEEVEEDMEYDLKSMIIAKTILDRPQY